MNKPIVYGGILIAIVIAITALHFPVQVSNQHGSNSFGATLASVNGGSYTAYNAIEVTDGIFVGATKIFDASGFMPTLLQTDAGQLHSYASATTTQATSETLVPGDVAGFDTVVLTPNNAGNTTLTLFASSTATTWLPTAGDTQHTCFFNSTTTANVYYIFAGGTGTTLLVASSTATALGSPRIGPQKVGCFDFVRGSASATTFDIIGAFNAFQ